jgi:hypothetical protein
MPCVASNVVIVLIRVAEGRVNHTVPLAFSGDEGADGGVDEATTRRIDRGKEPTPCVLKSLERPAVVTRRTGRVRRHFFGIVWRQPASAWGSWPVPVAAPWDRVPSSVTGYITPRR